MTSELTQDELNELDRQARENVRAVTEDTKTLEGVQPERVTEQMRRDHEAMEWLESSFCMGRMPRVLYAGSPDSDDTVFQVGCRREDHYVWGGVFPTLTDAILDAKAKWEAER